MPHNKVGADTHKDEIWIFIGIIGSLVDNDDSGPPSMCQSHSRTETVAQACSEPPALGEH